MPGTWGSLPTLILPLAGLFFLEPTTIAIALVVIAVGCTGLAWLAIPHAVRQFAQPDPSSVVIDEVIGQACASAIALFIAPHAPIAALCLSFVLFRVFDIAKPWPIAWAEGFSGTLGILLDDIFAGCLAGCLASLLLH